MLFVKKYIIKPSHLVRWVIVGSSKDYLVSINFCPCHSFAVNKNCKHILMLKDAMVSHNYDIFYLDSQEWKELRNYFYT